MTDLRNVDSIDSEVNNNEKGASMVEYALLVALIAVVAIVAVSVVGRNASTKFSEIAVSLQ